VTVLAHQSAWFAVRSTCIICPHRRDIDKQSGRSVNPSPVDDIRFVHLRSDDIVRVDLKKVGPSPVDIREIEMMLRHVIVVGKEVDRRFGNLNIEVVVPGKDLA
jgi:hypothetical protein